MLPLLIFATNLEAESTLHQGCFEPVSNHLWKSKTGYLLVCGMGALNACVHLTQTLHQIPRPSYLLNLGCAASLQTFEVFDCLQICQVSKYLERGLVDEHSQQFFEKTFPSLSLDALSQKDSLAQAKLTSVDCPFHSTPARGALSASSDLLDMEGYAIAMTAKLMELPLYMVKCISDLGQDKGFEAIRKNISGCSERLSDCYFKHFSLF